MLLPAAMPTMAGVESESESLVEDGVVEGLDVGGAAGAWLAVLVSVIMVGVWDVMVSVEVTMMVVSASRTLRFVSKLSGRLLLYI